jgi:hypothetical protein
MIFTDMWCFLSIFENQQVLCTEYDCDSEDEAFIVLTNIEYNSSNSSTSNSKAKAASSGSDSGSSTSSKKRPAAATEAVQSTALGKRKARSVPTATAASDNNDDTTVASGMQSVNT